ncbi:MAG: DEAD/DEAH box helicase [Candidatus Omnitrophica bacterium]|nr:DEAD/DEAH box helicase [Candidatus Omnitrophota bacterium]
MSHTNATFYHLGIAPEMLNVLNKLKFTTPTPIQHQAIPIALEGKDIIGVAQTGTGKTMAFSIPVIQRLAAEGGQALILVPTRELALQIEDAIRPLLKAFKMRSTVLIGGVKIGGQISEIKRKPDIIIATPGRLNDHIYQGTIDLGHVYVVVLDEADRMFDMGFAPQVKSVLRCVTNKKQTLLFSATMPQDVLKLATSNMQLPINIEIAPSGTTTKEISQELFIVKEPLKNDVLKMLLEQYRGSVLVFTRTKQKASRVTRNIRAMGIKAAEIHSNRSMGQRNQAIEGFKRGRFRVLVATDIAARGIDVNMIELVVNYDLSDDVENYVHRIGRTGRAGKEGHSVTMATPAQSHDVSKIEKLIKMALPRSTHPQFSGNDFIDKKVKPKPTEQKPKRQGYFGARKKRGKPAHTHPRRYKKKKKGTDPKKGQTPSS